VELGDYPGWMRCCTLISATGCPALSLPDGFTPEGLPVGPPGRRRTGGLIGGCRGSGTPLERAAGSGRRRPARG